VIGGVRGYCEPEPEQLLKMARVPDRHKKARAGVRGRVWGAGCARCAARLFCPARIRIARQIVQPICLRCQCGCLVAVSRLLRVRSIRLEFHISQGLGRLRMNGRLLVACASQSLHLLREF
jgi:hypothetical protein